MKRKKEQPDKSFFEHLKEQAQIYNEKQKAAKKSKKEELKQIKPCCITDMCHSCIYQLSDTSCPAGKDDIMNKCQKKISVAPIYFFLLVALVALAFIPSTIFTTLFWAILAGLMVVCTFIYIFLFRSIKRCLKLIFQKLKQCLHFLLSGLGFCLLKLSAGLRWLALRLGASI